MSIRTTATHPVIPGFHPDPTVCRVGEDYYLANSSFEFAPGVPIWHSRDLLSWTLIGNALDRADQFAPGHAAASKGVFAPTLRHHDGVFWLITTDVSGGGGQLLVTATDAAGPWSPPLRIPALIGIDPDIAWTAEGECLVTYCSTAPGLAGIAQAAIDPATGSVLKPPRPMWSGTGLAFPEAPHLYRRGEWWYLLVAEGGTERGHAVSVARSRSPRGPFQPQPSNPILSHRSTTHPVQNTGHADFVERLDGTWATVFLGVRPRGVTPQFHVNGRETFLADVVWEDEWPRVVESHHPLPSDTTSFLDEFGDEPLDPRWVSPGNGLVDFTEPVSGGGRRLRAGTSVGGNLNLLCARVVDHEWAASAGIRVDRGGAALRLRVDESHWCEIRADRESVTAWMRIGPLEQPIGITVAHDHAELTMTIAAVPATFGGPDDLRLSVSTDEGEVEIARVDGRYLSTEVAGGFTGRVVGVRAVDSETLVRAFSYRGESGEGSGSVPASAALVSR